MRRASDCWSSFSAFASFGSWSMLSFSSCGLTQMLSTGVEHRQRLAGAVGDGAAMRGDLDHAHRAVVALFGEKAVIEQLQLDRARREPGRAEHDESQHQAERQR